MSINDQVLDDDDDELEDESALLKRLRKQAKEGAVAAKKATDLEAELTSYRQRDALSGAGLDLDDDKRTALLAVHKGDLTPDALKATAVRLGWAEPPPPDVPAADLAAAAAIAAAGAGATHADADRDLDARLAAAKTEDEFMAIYNSSGRMSVPATEAGRDFSPE